MKTLKECYEIIDEKLNSLTFNEFESKYGGICILISRLKFYGIFNDAERIAIMKHFKSKKPWIFSREFYNSYFNYPQDYWWTRNKEGFERRKLFIMKIIESLK